MLGIPVKLLHEGEGTVPLFFTLHIVSEEP